MANINVKDNDAIRDRRSVDSTNTAMQTFTTIITLQPGKIRGLTNVAASDGVTDHRSKCSENHSKAKLENGVTDRGINENG